MASVFSKFLFGACGVLLTCLPARASSVAIVQGSFYTSNLKNNLVAAGQTVTEISTYTAASLASYDSVIVYGNDYADMTALTSYAQGGGTVIETPWFWLNNSPPTDLQVFSNGGGTDFSTSYPGVSVLLPLDPLLQGVTIPAGSGGFNIGRTSGNTFASGVTAVANWLDGTAFIGHKALGSGQVIGINMHVITSDTAYQVIDQSWATRLFVNASQGQAPVVAPLPSTATVGMVLLGLMGLWRCCAMYKDQTVRC